jgi:hypothetical protein
LTEDSGLEESDYTSIDDFVNYFINIKTTSSSTYHKLTPELLKNSSSGEPGDRFITLNNQLIQLTDENEIYVDIYKYNGYLKQRDGNNWVDISTEIVANKVTANYINALDITAKKITVIDENVQTTTENPDANIIFRADSATKDVKIAGFKANSDTLYGGGNGKNNYCKLSIVEPFSSDKLTNTASVDGDATSKDSTDGSTYVKDKWFAAESPAIGKYANANNLISTDTTKLN